MQWTAAEYPGRSSKIPVPTANAAITLTD
jgi:hypothetical protein